MHLTKTVAGALAPARGWLGLLVLSLLLVACGGGGGGSTGVGLPSGLSLMRDSFGLAIPEADFGLGSATAAGVDGTASDETPIANALVKVIDNAGHSVVGKTDAQGYYRVRVDGFVAPLIASVTRADGQVHFAATTSSVQVRGFVTLNLTSFTDKLASDAAVAAGFQSAAQLSTRSLATNPALLENARVAFNTQWASQIKAVGLDSSFNPVSKAFKPDGTGYAKLLADFGWSLNVAGNTVLTPRLSLGGSIVGLGNRSGLTLVNGTETLVIAPQSTTFLFNTRLVQNGSYQVSIASQPADLSCGVANGAGSLVQNTVTQVVVLCSQVTNSVGGTITGLGDASGLVLGSGGLELPIAPNAAGFVFSRSIPLGGSYAVYVVSQPVGKTCGVSNGIGVQQGLGPITTVIVSCSPNRYVLGGTVSGLGQSGLVLMVNGEAFVTVPALSTSFEFPARLPYQSSYTVTVYAQPGGQVCTVANGTGVMGTADVRSISVSCVTKTYPLGGLLNGLTGSGLVLASNGQILRPVPGETTFVFPEQLYYGTLYNVVVLAQPTGQTCTVTGASGKISESTLGTVSVSCTNSGG